jgi:ABC-type uncharacterized transport system substrate-binding protein
LGRRIAGVRGRRRAICFSVLFIFFLSVASSESSEIVIIGDTTLRPVNDVINFVNDALPNRSSVYSPQQVKGRLYSIINKERARVIVALGSDSLGCALSLPETVPVVYGLVIKPVNTKRRNISGVYMGTPVSEYLSYIDRFFPALRKIGTICRPADGDIVDTGESGRLSVYRAGNSYEFIKGVDALERSVDAILLLPERDLLTSTSVEEIFRSSYTVRKPVIGVSEKYVKRGALFALVFNEAAMGRQVGEMVKKVLREGDASGIAPSPPEKFDLFVNVETARMMKILLPGDLIRKARRVYP